MKGKYRILLSAILIMVGLQMSAQAQEYRSATKYGEPGKAPGMKVKLLSTVGDVKTYAVILSKGDEAVSGLTEFAEKYNVKSGHYQAIGDAMHIEVGWFDYNRKQFLVVPIDTAEITSFTGDIAWYKNKPVAHTHMTASLKDGSVKGGHLLQLIVGPTLEIIVTVEPTYLYKKLNEEFQAGLIDPDIKK
ncbi:PPC domain-containing DNA-binding protein [Pontibacter silvestris]|uniref:PPC domain-containing DNA-binding protein n=1 Tax=Pontibacter silvestris TaxID=2305183 RepID=A0ABW4WZT7_9BACT|nr:PPC domain-containing DNA-binding protein [Pontibacter silvestris]MCC9138471.1 DNA-binding protein [Pontibacter silvestris]